MIQSFKDFFDFNNKIFIYALICNNLNVEFTTKMRKLFTFLKNYKNCFDFKNARTLFEYKNKNYVIVTVLAA